MSEQLGVEVVNEIAPVPLPPVAASVSGVFTNPVVGVIPSGAWLAFVKVKVTEAEEEAKRKEEEQ